MKVPKRVTGLVWALALGFALVMPGETAWSSPVLEIAVSGDGGEFLPLLPVPLTIRVTNPEATTATVTPLVRDHRVSWHNPAADSLYQFVVSREDGKTVRAMFADWAWGAAPYIAGDTGVDPSRIAKVALAPGETWVQDYCLGYGFVLDGATTAIRPVFDAPGEYVVRLELPYLVAGGARSSEVTVRIIEPTGEADKKAREILRGSPRATMFLSPPMLEFSSLYYRYPDYGKTDTPPGVRVGDLAARILSECPGSAYAPYAELLLGKALTVRTVESGDSAHPRAPDVEKNAEGFRLLRQCAEDEKLPRRYREAALVRLGSGAAHLVDSIQQRASRSAPTLESILGTPLPDTGILPGLVFRFVSEIEAGTAPPGIEELLRSKLTAEQYEAVRKAVTSNPSVATSAGANPLQNELRGHSEWARQELRKLLWRNPATGELARP